jgi:CubicO group peptidase (beta-lactamase class C family)
MADRLKEVLEAIPGRMASAGVPSVAVAVARHGEVLWGEGFGWADRAREVRSSGETPYPIASITKPITATALMILVERGLVELDRPVNDYLGDAKIRARLGNAEDATVRRVASHTAGLPLHYHFFYLDETWRRPPMDLSISRYGHLVAPPGERFEYSNFGYGILESVVERVSGVAFHEFVGQEIFKPLEMTRSAVGLPAHASVAERYDSTGSLLPFCDFDHRGGSAAFSSAMDLLRFGMWHLDPATARNSPLGIQTTRLMRAPNTASGPAQGYGIGWRTLEDRNGLASAFHDGRMDGVTTRLAIVPAEDAAAVVLTNSNNRLCPELCDTILGAVIPGFRPNVAPRSRRAKKTRPVPSRLKRLVGEWSGSVQTYEDTLPVKLTIDRRRATTFQLEGQSPAIVEDVSWLGGRLKGVTRGDIHTGDAGKRPYRLHLDLTLRSGRLCGSITALSEPNTRLGSALSHWCDLAPSPGR